MSYWMNCRSGATLGFEPSPRVPNTYSVWSPEEEDAPRSTGRIPQAKSSGTVVALQADEPPDLDPLVAIIRSERRTEWFTSPIAEMPRRVPHISPQLLELAVEDE